MTIDPTPDRIPYCAKIRYGITGAPILADDDMDGSHAPGVGVRPTLIELAYSAARDGKPASVSASVTGDWVRFGKADPDGFGGQVTTHFKSGPDGWPAWLAEEARLHDPDAAPAPVSPPPATDRAGLRDRIRRAVCEAEGFAWDSDMLEPDEYGDHADMVLAALFGPIPAGTDVATWTAIRAIQLMNEAGQQRDAALLRAADIAESLRQFEPATGARKSAQVSENVGILHVAAELRRLGAGERDEQQAQQGGALRCICGDPVQLRDEIDPDGWIHSPGSDTPCLDARPCCPHCQMAHSLAPGSMGARVCVSIRERIAEAGRRHAEEDHGGCAAVDCETARTRLDEASSAKEQQAGGQPPADSAGEEAEPVPPVCQGFQWIGQSFATCDRCGQPAWVHDGEDVAAEGAGPFDNERTVRPWKPGEADAIRAKWAPTEEA